MKSMAVSSHVRVGYDNYTLCESCLIVGSHGDIVVWYEFWNLDSNVVSTVWFVVVIVAILWGVDWLLIDIAHVLIEFVDVVAVKKNLFEIF